MHATSSGFSRFTIEPRRIVMRDATGKVVAKRTFHSRREQVRVLLDGLDDLPPGLSGFIRGAVAELRAPRHARTTPRTRQRARTSERAVRRGFRPSPEPDVEPRPPGPAGPVCCTREAGGVKRRRSFAVVRDARAQITRALEALHDGEFVAVQILEDLVDELADFLAPWSVPPVPALRRASALAGRARRPSARRPRGGGVDGRRRRSLHRAGRARAGRRKRRR